MLQLVNVFVIRKYMIFPVFCRCYAHKFRKDTCEVRNCLETAFRGDCRDIFRAAGKKPTGEFDTSSVKIFCKILLVVGLEEHTEIYPVHSHIRSNILKCHLTA